MDIVTHAAMGAVIAYPMMPTHPLAAAGFMVGSVLPDLDALSRLFGKRAFLQWHQTFTHAIPLIVVGTLVGYFTAGLCSSEWQEAALALGTGMLFHTLLDYTNTFGVTLFFPFSKRRICRNWVFFIDAFVILLTFCAAVLIWSPISYWAIDNVVLCYILALLIYWALKIILKREAFKLRDVETISLVPSALVPWIFFGCRQSKGNIQTFSINLITRRQIPLKCYQILDEQYSSILDSVPEYRTMCTLTPAYHVVAAVSEGDQTRITCRDLRISNFNTCFGQLDLVLDDTGQIQKKNFLV